MNFLWNQQRLIFQESEEHCGWADPNGWACALPPDHPPQQLHEFTIPPPAEYFEDEDGEEEDED